MKKSHSAFLRASFGLLLSSGLALAVARVFAGTAVSVVLPLCFIAVLWILAFRYGFAVGVIGSLLAALIFAHFLFDPLGSWHVNDLAARRNLAWMVAGAIALSFLFAPSNSAGSSQQ
ncbi:MAG TPA: hypothetical protein VL240_09385 [Candidatus Binatia bacterium]|nr:hypothetical protein [Candidatus Binatia bacterium]